MWPVGHYISASHVNVSLAMLSKLNYGANDRSSTDVLIILVAFYSIKYVRVRKSLALKHWSLRQIKPAQLAFGRTLI